MAERFLVCPLQMANAVVTLRNTEIKRSKMMRLGATSMPTDPIDLPFEADWRSADYAFRRLSIWTTGTFTKLAAS
jgi:hypothetical protein